MFFATANSYKTVKPCEDDGVGTFISVATGELAGTLATPHAISPLAPVFVTIHVETASLAVPSPGVPLPTVPVAAF